MDGEEFNEIFDDEKRLPRKIEVKMQNIRVTTIKSIYLI